MSYIETPNHPDAAIELSACDTPSEVSHLTSAWSEDGYTYEFWCQEVLDACRLISDQFRRVQDEARDGAPVLRRAR